MKKSLFITLILGLALVFSANAQRFGTAKNQDNTGRVLTYGYSVLPFASGLTVQPNFYNQYYNVSVSGATTITLKVSQAKVLDEVYIIGSTDATQRIITLTTAGSNVAYSGPVTVAGSKNFNINLYFNGTKYVEFSRFVEP